MTEHDLGLKVGVRRLFWSMGLSTRLDVQLRGFSPPADSNRRSRAPQPFTDLDVLGVAVTSGNRLSTEIADCKTSQRDSTSRMFWVRGVADLFGADHAYLVREHDVSDAARQLSARLGITVLPSDDLARQQGHYDSPVSDHLSILFDRSAVAAHLAAFNSLDGRLKRLLDYRQFDYWVYEQHRNPVQLVAHLAGAHERLDPRNPVHVALFLDMSWLYLLSLIRVTAHIRGAFLADPDRGLQEYMFGGATNLREKQETARLLRSVSPNGFEKLDHLPPYYGQLRELVVRLLRRPAQMQTSLRYAEAAAALAAAKTRTSLRAAFGDVLFDPVAAKLVADVCGFLVAAADLDSGFRSRARAYLLAETPPVEPDARSTRTLLPDGSRSQAPHRSNQLSLDETAAEPSEPDEAPTTAAVHGGASFPAHGSDRRPHPDHRR